MPLSAEPAGGAQLLPQPAQEAQELTQRRPLEQGASVSHGTLINAPPGVLGRLSMCAVLSAARGSESLPCAQPVHASCTISSSPALLIGKNRTHVTVLS